MKAFCKGTNMAAVFLVCAVLSLSAVAATFRAPAVAAATDTVDIRLTGLHSYTPCDGANRFVFCFDSDYGALFTSADSREEAAAISLTLEIDGQPFTFAAGKYVVAFGQYPLAGSERFLVYLKRDEKDVVQSGVPAGFYNDTYPGLEAGQEHTVRFPQGMRAGKYRLAAECEVRIAADDTATFFSNPHAVTVTDGDAEGTQVWKDEILASEGARIRITPHKKAGYTATGLVFTDGHGTAEIPYTADGGSFLFDMPSYAVNVRVTYEEAHYTLSVGGQTVTVYPDTPIGTLPDGKWQIDGYPISETSLWVWTADKTALARTEDGIFSVAFYDGDDLVHTAYYTLCNTAVRFPDLKGKAGYNAKWESVKLNGGDKVVHAVYTPVVYTAVFMADGNKVKEVQFTVQTKEIELPVIPRKEGFEIVGWDLDGFPTGNVIVNAIYKRIED